MVIKDNICFYNMNKDYSKRIKKLMGNIKYDYTFSRTIEDLTKINKNIRLSLIISDEAIDEIEKTKLIKLAKKAQTSWLLLTKEDSFGSSHANINNEEYLYHLIKTLCRLSWVLRLRKDEIRKISLKDSYLKTLDLIDELDTHTKSHSNNVREFAVEIGKALKLNKEDISKLYTAGLIHDIGKTVIPKEILISPKKLTFNEFEIIKLHTTILDEIIDDEFTEIKDIIKHHHEKYNGTGYPDKLKGEDISLLSRIITVVDSYDAMTAKRIYNTPVSLEEAIRRLTSDSGTHFDPDIVKAFVEILKQNK